MNLAASQVPVWLAVTGLTLSSLVSIGLILAAGRKWLRESIADIIREELIKMDTHRARPEV